MKLKNKYEIMELDEQYIAVPVGNEAKKDNFIVKLNESAMSVFKLLMSETTVDQLIEALGKEYLLEGDQSIEFVKKFLADLAEKGILTGCGSFK